MSSLLPDSLPDRDAPPRALVEALREEPIQPARIEHAYARFRAKSAPAPARWRGPRVVRHAAFAVLMAVGTVYAATLITPLTADRQANNVEQPEAAPTPSPRTAVTRRAPSTSEERASRAIESTAEAESAEPLAPAPTVPAPTVPAPTTSAPTTAVREQPLRSVAPVPSAEQWRRAAQGLRDGDYRSADAALKALSRSGTEADRESALLVQAQVLLAQGRDAEAKSLLKSLQRSARAPSVRRKSEELLGRLRDRPAARPDKTHGVTDLP